MQAILISLMLFVAVPLFAQSEPFQAPLEISISPSFPAPGSTASARVTSPTIDLTDATIVWQVDGGEPASGGRTQDIAVGSGGRETIVTVRVESGGALYEATRRIVPASVDLVWSAMTYSPPLYPGRSRPTPGSRVRIEAIPSFVSEGTTLQAEDLIYTWYRNDALLESASGKGRSVLEVDAPILFGTDTVRVEVTSRDRRIAAEEGIRFSSDDPRVLLYENHPIFGLRLNRALRVSSIEELETTVTAIPFDAAYAPRDPSLIYEWRVNGQSVAADATYPNSLTLNAEDSSGKADISLFLSHGSNIFFGARGGWDLTLRSGTDIADPFFAPRN